MNRVVAAGMMLTVLFFYALLAIAGTKVRLDVTPKTSFAPTRVKVKAQVERSDANRVLGVWIDGEDFYTSDSRELEGSAAPITYWFEFRSVPAGEYQIGATVVNSLGKVIGEATTNIIVIGEQ